MKSSPGTGVTLLVTLWVGPSKTNPSVLEAQRVPVDWPKPCNGQSDTSTRTLVVICGPDRPFP